MTAAALAPVPRTDTVVGILRLGAARDPGRLAVVGPDGRSLTYSRLLQDATRIGHGLIGLGLRPGDRVAAWLQDTVDYVRLYAACAVAGLVVVPINTRFTVHEATFPLSDSGARVLVLAAGLGDRLEGLAFDGVVVSDVPTGDPARLCLDDLAHLGSGTAHPPVAPDALYMIGYTSGTTGRPKGAQLTQGSVATIARMNALAYRLPIGSIAAMTGSMSFVAVVPSHVISHFYMGGTVRLLERWDVESLADLIAREHITFSYLPSPVLADFATATERYPSQLASLVTLLHSGSKASPDKLRRVAEVVGGRLVEGWGMTENSGGLATATVPADVLAQPGGPDRLSTAGRPVPGVQVRVVDPLGEPLPHDGTATGELVVASPALMTGYWNRPEETALALQDGWYRSGDVGTVDDSGYVTVSERRVDLIVSGGMNVYPSEVEDVILGIPGVVACAVVGLPHERWGQSVAAAVVTEPAAPVDEQTVLDRCRDMLAGYKKPTRVEFLSALPMTTSQKVSRAAVRDRLRAEPGRP